MTSCIEYIVCLREACTRNGLIGLLWVWSQRKLSFCLFNYKPKTVRPILGYVNVAVTTLQQRISHCHNYNPCNFSSLPAKQDGISFMATVSASLTSSATTSSNGHFHTGGLASILINFKPPPLVQECHRVIGWCRCSVSRSARGLILPLPG